MEIPDAVSGVDKFAFKKGVSGAQFGDKCLRSYPKAVWVVADKKDFPSDQIWMCPPDGTACRIIEREAVRKYYKSPSGGNAILLELIDSAQEIHANKYTCQTEHWTDAGEEFEYQVTIYGRESVCVCLCVSV